MGICLDSKTGNTLSVAQKLQQRLMETGHSVSLEQIKVAKDDEMIIEKI